MPLDFRRCYSLKLIFSERGRRSNDKTNGRDGIRPGSYAAEGQTDYKVLDRSYCQDRDRCHTADLADPVPDIQEAPWIEKKNMQ